MSVRKISKELEKIAKNLEARSDTVTLFSDGAKVKVPLRVPISKFDRLPVPLYQDVIDNASDLARQRVRTVLRDMPGSTVGDIMFSNDGKFVVCDVTFKNALNDTQITQLIKSGPFTGLGRGSVTASRRRKAVDPVMQNLSLSHKAALKVIKDLRSTGRDDGQIEIILKFALKILKK